jgi:hypothetical protein
MANSSIGRIVLGFIAAAISVVVVHQSIVYGLTIAGVIRGQPWSMAPFGPFGIPTIANSVFWGGLWGALFGLIHDRLPGDSSAIKGLVYGLLIVVFSNWLLLPLIRGQIFGQPN